MNWKFVTIPNEQVPAKIPLSVQSIEQLGQKIYSATVPGSFIFDMVSAGDLPDLEYSQNILLARQVENLHVIYYTEVFVEKDEYLHFEGIDTIADVYVNGEFVAHSDNMFLPLDVHADWKEGPNTVVVHIKPICLEARKYPLPASTVSPFYTQEGLYMRKTISSFGWDILPRFVTAGIHKPVTICKRKHNAIEDVFVTTGRIDYQNNTARLRAYFQFRLEGDFSRDYSVKIVGKCNNSVFEKTTTVWHTSHSFSIDVENVQLWNPKNYGEPNLYDVKVFLYCKEKVVDEYAFSYGIRMVELVHNKEEFRFVVNSKTIFAMGSNWVPISYDTTEQSHRLSKALALLDESGANMVRIWGGGYYEDDKFYDFCDKHGILVWQDFMMACAIYPQDEEFSNKIYREASYQIRRLRNHCCIALWCGDNECDQAMVNWSDFIRNPESNVLTRKVLPDVLNNHDFTRPYIPSSPHIYGGQMQHNCVERHLWTRTEHFTSPFYLNTTAKFISEIGYTAFPSVTSLKKFLQNPQEILRDDGSATDEYVLHGTAPDLQRNAWYDHKVPCACLFASQVFAPLSKDLERLVLQSQYTQAEAYKTWIEHARASEDIQGMLLWNLLDGWPQVSEAMVDYYFDKKPSFDFVKRAQRPVNVIIKQKSKGNLQVVVVNDGRMATSVNYEISCCGNVVANGKLDILPDEKKIAQEIHTNGESNFYQIKFWLEGEIFLSHYQENPTNLNLDVYLANITATYHQKSAVAIKKAVVQ